MRKRSGTLEIGFRSGGRPEDYEGEYQCFATNDFGVSLSNKILLRVSSKITEHTNCCLHVIHSFVICRTHPLKLWSNKWIHGW